MPPEKGDVFQFVKGDLYDQLAKANLLITNASSIAMEALALGRPVIIIERSTGLHQNPIPDDVPTAVWRKCCIVADLQDQVLEFMRLQRQNLIDFERIGKDIRDTYFMKVTREGVAKFLGLS